MLGVGLLSPVGYLGHWPALELLGRASAASPLPLVFYDMDGYEEFASLPTLVVRTRAGQELIVPITAETVARLRGPVIRLHPYILGVSEGPRKQAGLLDPLLTFAFCDPGRLAEELGLPRPLDAVTLRYTTRTEGRSWFWTREVACP